MGEIFDSRFARTLAAGLFAAAAVTAGMLSPASASATTVTTAALFNGTNGAAPLNRGVLILGNTVFGTTYAGGSVAGHTANDLGAVYSLPTDLSVPAALLYSFSGTDGAHPNGPLAADAQGNLYGTTATGGTADMGTVFKLTKPGASGTAWTLTTLHTFTGPDGANPAAGVTLGPDGSIYGTAAKGGVAVYSAYASGTLFKISPAGSFSVLHAFGAYEGDGYDPESNIVLDPTGVIIGATKYGTAMNEAGTLYAVAANGQYKVVAPFNAHDVGMTNPTGIIARDRNGNVYGMAKTYVFEVTAVTHQLLPRFNFEFFPEPQLGGAALAEHPAGGVLLDNAGNLYGTLVGDAAQRNGGSIFVLPPNAFPTKLVSFDYANQAPEAGVVFDAAGNLWGTSSAGGSSCMSAASLSPTGCGTVFKVTP